jgi:hypothetical protein
MQFIIFVGVYLIIPDYPAKNQGLTYFNILTSMAKSAVTEPKLIQAMIALLWSNTCFASYWVCLSRASHSYFHLFVPPSYIDICAWWTTLSPLYMHIFRCSHCIWRLWLCRRLVIGLFGLIGMFGITVGPFVGRIVSHLVSWYATLLPPCHHRDHSSSPTIIVVCNVGGLCPLFRHVWLHCWCAHWGILVSFPLLYACIWVLQCYIIVPPIIQMAAWTGWTINWMSHWG